MHVKPKKLRFAQLYVYDTENELQNRLSLFSDYSPLDQNIVQNMFNSNNAVVKSFRMARDRFSESNLLYIKLKLSGKWSSDNS